MDKEFVASHLVTRPRHVICIAQAATARKCKREQADADDYALRSVVAAKVARMSGSPLSKSPLLIGSRRLDAAPLFTRLPLLHRACAIFCTPMRTEALCCCIADGLGASELVRQIQCCPPSVRDVIDTHFPSMCKQIESEKNRCI